MRCRNDTYRHKMPCCIEVGSRLDIVHCMHHAGFVPRAYRVQIGNRPLMTLEHTMLRRMTSQAQARYSMHVIIEPNWSVLGIKTSASICDMACTYELHPIRFTEVLTYVALDASIRSHKVDLSSAYATEFLF